MTRLSLTTDTATLIRRSAPGTYVKGRWKPGTVSAPVSIACSIQPISGKTLERLPEGQRVGDLRVMYTETEVFMANEISQTKSDLVDFKGRRYEVELVEQWFGPIPHFKCVLRGVRIEEQP